MQRIGKESAMAITRTTWTKGTNPKGKGGAKAIKTRVKESIGLDGWENFCNYIKTEGAEKLKYEMSKLKGKEFINAFSVLVEYIKPKLNRVTMEGDRDSPIHIVTKEFSNLSVEDIENLLEK